MRGKKLLSSVVTLCSPGTSNDENPHLIIYLELYLLNRYTFFRQLREENHNAKEEIMTLETKNSEMMSMLNQSNQKILELEKELNEKKRLLKEKNVLVSENAELRALNAQQHNNLNLCHQEMENSRRELNLLQTIISQLSLSTSEEVQ